MSKMRKNKLCLRDNIVGSVHVMHVNDGQVHMSDGDVNQSRLEVTWQDYIYDGAPSRPTYTSVLRSAFQWKAKYGTPASRLQHEQSLLRRATLARNRALRQQYYNAVDRYRSSRFKNVASYNPYTGVLNTAVVPVFRQCENSQTRHKVVRSGSRTFVTNAYWWTSWGYTKYITYTGALSNLPPYFYADRVTLSKNLGECFRIGQLDDAKVARIISSKILNDASLMNIKDGKFSLLTFFAELGDIKSLPSLLKKWTGTSHDISSKYLGVNFGVLPFYSDICAILDRLNNLPYAIDEWNRNATDGRIRSYHCTINPKKIDALYEPDKPLKRSDRVSIGSYYRSGVYLYTSTTLTQKVSIKGHVYLMPRVIPDDKIAALKQHIWGVNTPLSTAWEKIPFSFVVDWFLHLGELIQEFEEEVDQLEYRIVDAGYSIKIESDWVTTHGSEPYYGDLSELQSSNTYYVRRPLSPQSLGKSNDEPYTITGLNLKQSTLSAALVHQQLKR